MTDNIKPTLKRDDVKTTSALSGSVFISGGGPVGLMLALGLARLGVAVTLAEKFSASSTQADQSANSFDGRVLALSHGSMWVLASLGVWSSLREFVEPITSVHVSQKGYMGVTHLTANEMDVDALGYSVTASDLGQVLWAQVNEHRLINVLRPATVENIAEKNDRQCVDVSVAGNIQTFEVDLVVGADGTQSRVRTCLDLPIETKHYGAVAIIARIETELSPNGWAYERFTTDGPVALLPMKSDKGFMSKAVLVCPDEKFEAIKALDDSAFLDLFAKKMGERLGYFESISERVYYPLQETYVPNMVKGRAVLMGNASHTQHPVAAQGLNLGIADINAFLQQAVDGSITDLGHTQFLTAYAESRHAHHEKIMGMTDGLIKLFEQPSPIIGHLRGIGLMAMQFAKPARKRFSKLSMGVSQ